MPRCRARVAGVTRPELSASATRRTPLPAARSARRVVRWPTSRPCSARPQELLARPAGAAGRGRHGLRSTAARSTRAARAASSRVSTTVRRPPPWRTTSCGSSPGDPFLAAAAARPGPGRWTTRSLDGEVSAGGNALALLADLIERARATCCGCGPTPGGCRASRDGVVVGDARSHGRALAARSTRRGPARGARGLVGAGLGRRAGPASRRAAHPVLSSSAPTPCSPSRSASPTSRGCWYASPVVEALTLLLRGALGAGGRRCPASTAARPGRPQRFLLRQLAAGAKDEQIARTLGVSLRTVRRRIADLMTELGADSRFQAGVEAARRGWL